MSLKKVVWSDLAISDLTEIRNYIEKESVNNAKEVFKNIFSSTRNLELFPEKGRVIPSINKDFYREYFILSYRIMYKIDNERIVIAAIFHMSKNFIPKDLLERK